MKLPSKITKKRCWYIERSVQAAENFVAAVDKALQLICEYPTRWRNEHKNFYELGVKKYTYTIIYTIEEKNHLIVVSAIYHHKRNPKKKYRKKIGSAEECWLFCFTKPLVGHKRWRKSDDKQKELLAVTYVQ